MCVLRHAPGLEAGTTAVPLRWGKLRGKEGNGMYSKMTSLSHNAFKIRAQAAVWQCERWQCERMPSQTRRIWGAPHSCHGAAVYGHNHLFAVVHHMPVARHARRVERASPSHPLLAHRHASPVSRAENRGRIGPLDTGLDHCLALAPRAQSRVLGYPSAGGVVSRGNPADLATAPRRDTPSGGRL